ncbi:DUF565 domain-containing protein [Phormidium tenue FACHB-886]|nr:DUF565 domain-containing protein [Phormidium tenue FACHB-886]
MQNTRLNILVDGLVGQFSRWLQNPWRRLSVLLISLLGGNFLATTVSTVAGQKADIDVVVAGLLVLITELVSWLMYRFDRRRPRQDEPNPLIFELLNGVKLGLTYGLFVEAFKLGS